LDDRDLKTAIIAQWLPRFIIPYWGLITASGLMAGAAFAVVISGPTVDPLIFYTSTPAGAILALIGVIIFRRFWFGKFNIRVFLPAVVPTILALLLFVSSCTVCELTKSIHHPPEKTKQLHEYLLDRR
jgi:hypothetical protein